MIIIDGKKIQKEVLAETKEKVSKLSFQPVFCDILVGEDLASEQYVEMKARVAEKIGIRFHPAKFRAEIKESELLEEIKKINQLPNIAGIIIQLPLPKHLVWRKILDASRPELDVDCLGKVNSQKFYLEPIEKIKIIPPTAAACLTILDSLHLDWSGKKITVLGRGELVGRPVARLLELRGYRVQMVGKDTKNKEIILKNSDLIISGIGQPHFIKGEMLKKGVVLIDAGTSELEGGVVGDADLESVKEVASFVSPVPGGVGPVTIAMLLSNVLKAAKEKNKTLSRSNVDW